MEIVSIVQDKWEELMALSDHYADPRVGDWLLMSSPLPTWGLTIGYLIFIKLGQMVMANREPFNLRSIIKVYNVFLVALNAFICFELGYTAYKLDYGLCASVDTDPKNELSLRMAKALWWYYFSKLIEFLDTIFFMLGKKNRNISFLHLFHHSTMFPIWWMGVKWAPGGQSYFGAMFNSAIHVVMYTYYFLSACGDSFKPYLWWKKYLTTLQLCQFTIVFADTVYALYLVRTGQCFFYEWMGWCLAVYCILMIMMFSAFYKAEYLADQRAKAEAAKQKKTDAANPSASASSASASSAPSPSRTLRSRAKASTD